MLNLRIDYVAIQLCKDTLPNPESIYSKLIIKIPDGRHWSRPVSSLITLNYFKDFPSFPNFGFEQLNICWRNYRNFYSFDICFNVSTGGRQDLTRGNAENSVTHSVWSNLRKPLITQIIHSSNTRKFINGTIKLWGHKNKAGDCRESITSDHFPF